MGDDRSSEVREQSDASTLDALHYDDEELPARDLKGRIGLGVAIIAFAVAVLVLWQVFRPLARGSQFYLIIFLAGTLPLVFLAYRSRLTRKKSDRPTITDWALAAAALVVCLYPISPFGGGYDSFLNRQGLLEPADIAFGAVLLVLVVEACRRTTGWALPAVCLAFLAYGYYGGLLPQNWAIAHNGLDFSQIVDALYNSGSGFYGTPLDVAATYIVLFTIYGAVLDLSGASRFFVDLSVAAFRKSRSAAGRTAVAAGFLLGTVSGSGTATAVSVGAVTWPMLRRAGYPPEQAGGMLAAAGVGAILSPPTLGAAAFIVAEYLDVSYLTVLGWAMIPTVLYYLGILLAVEIDVRRFKVRSLETPQVSTLRLLGRFGYHFSSLVLIVVLLALGQSAMRAVVYATLLAFALSFLDRRSWLTPQRLFTALSAGVRSVLPVVAVCAAAGIITATTTKTGLGAQLASLLVRGARAVTDNPTAVLALTVILAAVALAILGLAVPVTASFIIGWVIIGPALLALGVPAPAAAMFVFYYSVLSEVTPPTALAAVGASAITGGRTIPTMWQALKYALPAFLAPIAFVLTPSGSYLLARGPFLDIVWASAAAMLGVAGLAIATGGWVLGVGRAGTGARVLAALAGLLLLYLEPLTIALGVLLLAASAAWAALNHHNQPIAHDAVRPEDRAAVRPEDRAAVRPEDRAAVRPEDRAVRVEDGAAVRVEDGAAMRVEDRDAIRVEDGDAVRVEDGAAVRAEDGAAVRPKDRDAVGANDRDAVRAEDGDAVRAEDGDAVRAEDGDAVRAEDGDAVRAEDGDAVRAEDGDAVRAEDRDAVRAEDGDAVRAEDGDAVRAERDDAVRADDRDALQAEHGNAARARERDAVRAEERDTTHTEERG